MFHSKVHIEQGDIVILFMVRTDMVAIKVEQGGIFHNKFGRYRHQDMIGMKYGSKMHSPPPQSGYIYLLRPTPELWTLSLPHRTQILYNPDISYIIQRLGIRVGGKVLEAGTGSGSMTHSLSRTVGPKGYVGSYEYHATRCEKAKLEFEEHGLGNVRLEHRNVCKDGFGEVEGVEAVFLDLPAPWEAIPHAIKTFRPDVIAKICCFSPCLEQVLKTVSTLREHGFSDISTQEVLVRTYELAPAPLPGSSHLRSVEDIVSSLSEHEKKKSERRAIQMKTAREKARRIREEKAAESDPEGREIMGELEEMLRAEIDGGGGEGNGRKRKVDESSAVGDADADADTGGKRPRVDDLGVGVEQAEIAASTSADPETDTSHTGPTDNPTNGDISAVDPPPNRVDVSPKSSEYPIPPSTISSQLLLRLQPEMRGHTSYLTFATYHPAHIHLQLAEQGIKSGFQTTPRIGTPVGTSEAEAVVAIPAAAGRTEVTGVAVELAIVGTAPSVVATERTETEYGDQAMEEVMGTLTEEEMIAMIN